MESSTWVPTDLGSNATLTPVPKIPFDATPPQPDKNKYIKNITIILDKEIKATNYQIDTYKKKIYIYGIALTSDEKKLVIKEAKEILDVKDVIASILIVDDLRIQKN